MKVYNGEGIVLGRLASFAAKDALWGEEVKVLNCEKVIISGKPVNTQAWQQQRRNRIGYPPKSQTHSRSPELMVRRSIRGMLPWRMARGREAYTRVKCYRGLPAEFASVPQIVLTKESSAKLPSLNYITIGDLGKQLGGKVRS